MTRLAIEVAQNMVSGVLCDNSGNVIEWEVLPYLTGAASSIRQMAAWLFQSTDADHVSEIVLSISQAYWPGDPWNPVAVIRIGPPSISSLPPFQDWHSLRHQFSHHVAIVHGGHRYDGREGQRLAESAIRDFVRSLSPDVTRFAVTAAFSPINPAHELRVQEIIEEMRGPSAVVALSHEVSSLGLLERENATILTAALSEQAERLVDEVRHSVQKLGMYGPIYVVRNDGGLMLLERLPRQAISGVAPELVTTIRGLMRLVPDTAQVVALRLGSERGFLGTLTEGYEALEMRPLSWQGVRVSLAIPDIIPLPFGSDSMRMGTVDLGTAVAAVRRAGQRLQRQTAPPHIVAAGVGVDPLLEVAALDMSKPPGSEAAGALGAAYGTVIGHADRIFHLRHWSRAEAVAWIVSAAKRDAVMSGARPSSLDVLDVNEVALSYLPGQAIRFRASVQGRPAI